jgi:hypothetical protein
MDNFTEEAGKKLKDLLIAIEELDRLRNKHYINQEFETKAKEILKHECMDWLSVNAAQPVPGEQLAVANCSGKIDFYWPVTDNYCDNCYHVLANGKCTHAAGSSCEHWEEGGLKWINTK